MDRWIGRNLAHPSAAFTELHTPGLSARSMSEIREHVSRRYPVIPCFDCTARCMWKISQKCSFRWTEAKTRFGRTPQTMHLNVQPTVLLLIINTYSPDGLPRTVHNHSHIRKTIYKNHSNSEKEMRDVCGKYRRSVLSAGRRRRPGLADKQLALRVIDHHIVRPLLTHPHIQCGFDYGLAFTGSGYCKLTRMICCVFPISWVQIAGRAGKQPVSGQRQMY